MNTNLPAITQDAKVALAKTKNLMDITNKILANRSKALADILLKKPYVSLGHGGEVHSVVFSPDGMTVLSGSEDETLKLWDIRSGKS
ncbi:MAG: WD40 domain-containing protein, partial [Epsilonproteobacteria bacterium]|nr:WD40 domain-containing protein [Campylobacterota bacterium]